MNVCLLEVAICEKCRSSHFSWRGGSKAKGLSTGSSWGGGGILGGGGGGGWGGGGGGLKSRINNRTRKL